MGDTVSQPPTAIPVDPASDRLFPHRPTGLTASGPNSGGLRDPQDWEAPPGNRGHFHSRIRSRFNAGMWATPRSRSPEQGQSRIAREMLTVTQTAGMAANTVVMVRCLSNSKTPHRANSYKETYKVLRGLLQSHIPQSVQRLSLIT